MRLTLSRHKTENPWRFSEVAENKQLLIAIVTCCYLLFNSLNVKKISFFVNLGLLINPDSV